MTAKSRHTADHLIDITGDICPITFVKTKLALEKMAPGTVLAVDLKGQEPLDNVPRSARDAGHEVLGGLPLPVHLRGGLTVRLWAFAPPPRPSPTRRDHRKRAQPGFRGCCDLFRPPGLVRGRWGADGGVCGEDSCTPRFIDAALPLHRSRHAREGGNLGSPEKCRPFRPPPS